MKNLKISLLAMAFGLLSSAGALSAPGAEPGIAADAVLAPADTKLSAARLDAIYEAAKNHCGTFPMATRARCLEQMKTSFGRR